jgi:hypothetical protein
MLVDFASWKRGALFTPVWRAAHLPRPFFLLIYMGGGWGGRMEQVSHPVFGATGPGMFVRGARYTYVIFD